MLNYSRAFHFGMYVIVFCNTYYISSIMLNPLSKRGGGVGGLEMAGDA